MSYPYLTQHHAAATYFVGKWCKTTHCRSSQKRLSTHGRRHFLVAKRAVVCVGLQNQTLEFKVSHRFELFSQRNLFHLTMTT